MRRPEWPARVAVSATVALAAALQLLAYVTMSPRRLAARGMLMDDAYFYSTLAGNLRTFGFLTLDGDMPTNGVQPLWMMLQGALATLFPSIDPVTTLCVTTWLSYVAFAFAAAWYINRRPSASSLVTTAVLAGPVLLQPRFQDLVVQGLETPLALLVLVATLLVFDRTFGSGNDENNQPTAAQALLLGFLAVLVFLSRTDLFWVPVVIGAWLLYADRRLSRRFVLFGTVVALVAAPYLVFNQLSQGSLMPISGRVKLFYLSSFFPDVASYVGSDQWQGPYYVFENVLRLDSLPVPRLIRYGFAFILFSLSVCCVWWKPVFRWFPASMRMLSIVVVLHLAYMHLLYRELRPYTAYYFVPELIFTTLVIGVLLGRLLTAGHESRPFLALSRRTARALLVVLLSVIAVTTVRGWMNHEYEPEIRWEQRLNIADDVARLVPAGEKVGAFWPGLFSEFCGRPVIPMDGVIGSDTYFREYVKTGREMEYLSAHGTRHLVIFLDRSADELLAGGRPEIPNWSMLGTVRLWEARDSVKQVLSARPVNEHGAGWYLVELE